ncbi:MAG: arsenate reductase [Janthinobacterium lividum]
MALRVYGIPNCSTVKKARDWLDARQLGYVFHDYKKAGIDADTLRAWLAEVPLDTLLNRRGTTWRALDDASHARAATEDGAIALMVAQPSLIKRPVLVSETDAAPGARRVLAVGFAPDTYETIYKAIDQAIDKAMTAR